MNKINEIILFILFMSIISLTLINGITEYEQHINFDDINGYKINIKNDKKKLYILNDINEINISKIDKSNFKKYDDIHNKSSNLELNFNSMIEPFYLYNKFKNSTVSTINIKYNNFIKSIKCINDIKYYISFNPHIIFELYKEINNNYITNINYKTYNKKYININEDIIINTDKINYDFTIYIHNNAKKITKIIKNNNNIKKYVTIEFKKENNYFDMQPKKYYKIKYYYKTDELYICDDEIFKFYNVDLFYDIEIFYKFEKNENILLLYNHAKNKYDGYASDYNLCNTNVKTPVNKTCISLKKNKFQYITLPKCSIESNGISFSMWILSNNNNPSCIFDIGNGRFNNNIIIGTYDDILFATIYMDKKENDYVIKMKDNTHKKWFHLVWNINPKNIIDNTCTWSFYVNGINISNIYNVYPKNGLRNMNFIGKSNSSDKLFSFFNGSISDFRMYNRILTFDEITCLYNMASYNDIYDLIK